VSGREPDAGRGRGLRILFIGRGFPAVEPPLRPFSAELSDGLKGISELRTLTTRSAADRLPVFLPFASVIAALFPPRNGVVLLGDCRMSAAGWAAKRLHKKTKVVCIVHGPDLADPSPRYAKRYLRRFLPVSDLVIATSRDAEDAVIAEGIPFTKVAVIAHGDGMAWTQVALHYVETIADRLTE
jgi:hypothetical protein